MLVTLGTNQAIGANSSVTFPYACTSLQRVFVKVDDDASANLYTVTVQLGQRTIMNGVSSVGLLGFSALQGGSQPTGTESYCDLDFGTHALLDNENVYVTISAGTGALTAVDVSAIVDEPQGEFPIRYTEYSDTTFTAENVKLAICFNSSSSAIDEDASNCEMRNPVSSSSPTFISSNNWFGATSVLVPSATYGVLCKNPVPLNTTFNYSASATVDRILVASQMVTTTRAIRQQNSQRSQARRSATRNQPA
jgi:hypothetical protein